MSVFEKLSLTVLTVMTLFWVTVEASATPKRSIEGKFSLEVYAKKAGLSFVPPAFDYSPISPSVPLVRPTTWQAIGQNAVLVGDYQNALAAFDKAVQLLPEPDPEILEQRGWLHYSLGDENAALRDMSKAAVLHLNNRSYSAHNNVLEMREFVAVQFDS